MPVYLDYNATAPLHREAADAMASLAEQPANASSVHSFGRTARAMLDKARGTLASHLGVSPHEIIFTSGGTEANNLLLSNFDHIITTAIEHDAVLAACPDARLIGCDRQGRLVLAALETELQACQRLKKRAVVSVMAANNETGVIQPFEEVAALCRHYCVPCHSDMVQYLGKADINLQESALSFASFSAHKIGGPGGVGALWCRSGEHLASLLRGGGQEQGRRAGTENLAGIIGFCAAIDCIDIEALRAQAQWRDMAEAMIMSACPQISVIGSNADRLANTSALYLPGVAAQTAVMMLDLQGFAVSAGAACSSGKVKPSHVIAAMGIEGAAGHVIRLSGGWQTSEADWTGVAGAVIELYKRGAA